MLSLKSRVLPFRQQQNCPGTTYMSIDDQSNSASTKDSDDAIELCVICLDPFLNGEDICVSQNDSCYHQFHMKCALEWLVKSQLCPCCRRDYFAKASGEPESEAFAATQVHGGPLRTDGS